MKSQPGQTEASRRRFLQQTLLTAGATVLAAQNTACRALARRSARRGWQIGAYTRPWDQWDYRAALDGIAEAGFKHCGIMTAKGRSWIIVTADTSTEEAARIGRDARERGLTVASLYAGDFPVASSIPAGLTGLQRLIDNCAALGSPNLMLGGVGDALLYDAYITVVCECCPYAAAKGIGLSLKPHGGLNATGAQCRKAVELVAQSDFRIWYDPGNVFYYSDGRLDPVADAADVDGLVVGMSVKDFRPPKEVMVTPGTGRVDFGRVLKRLHQGGFTGGPLIVECLERGDFAKVTAEARKARVFLEELIASLA